MQTQNTNPGFKGWEKWALMSVLVIGLSAVVIYFNITVFGLADGWPYIAVVSFIVMLSFIVTLHIKRHKVTNSFLVAVFIFDVLLTLALSANVVYSLSVQREMSVAGQAQADQRETINAIGKLKGSKAQREALKMAGNQAVTKTRQQVFGENERVLFWIMMVELGVALLATFTLLGLSVFDRNQNGVPDVFESQTEAENPFPHSLPNAPTNPLKRP